MKNIDKNKEECRSTNEFENSDGIIEDVVQYSEYVKKLSYNIIDILTKMDEVILKYPDVFYKDGELIDIFYHPFGIQAYFYKKSGIIRSLDDNMNPNFKGNDKEIFINQIPWESFFDFLEEIKKG